MSRTLLLGAALTVANVCAAQSATFVQLGPVAQVIAEPGVDIDARFDPAGTRLVFASSRSGSLEIWMRILGASALYQITTATNGSADRNPSFTPDGRTIVFQSDRVTGVRNIWAVGVADRSLVQLTNYRDGASHPSISPDGKSICFTRSLANGRTSIWLMSAEGAEPRALHDGVDCAWTPDGRRIVFAANSGSDDHPQYDIWAMKPDGNEAASLTNTALSWERSPAVSPDGRFLLYSAYQGAFSSDLEEVRGGIRIRPNITAGIWLLDLSSVERGAQQIVEPAGFNSFGSWSSDGTKIVFTSTRSGSADVYVVEVRPKR
jgi:Tol biopolymer transport system component